jgi:hypothetical protein
VITKTNFCLFCIMFMVLFNFHLSSRSSKITEPTLIAKPQTLDTTQTANNARTEVESTNKREEANAKEEEKNVAKLQSESKAEKQEKKEKKFLKKVSEAVKKRLADMPLCSGNFGGNGTDGNESGILGGTNVFEGKINATDAVGMVGFTNYSVFRPPYKVKRCDQILLLPGKKLDMKDYCIKEDAFMTMSIYMVNFFLKKNPDKLLESFPMDQITTAPSQLPGAPGCTMWITKYRSFPYCYASEEILEQVIQAYYDFMNCRKGPQGPRVAGALLKACDISKLDLTVNGPFGAQGPAYQQIIFAMDPSQNKKKKTVNLDDINPYYINDSKVQVPGSYLNNMKTRMNGAGRNPGNY